MQGKSPDSRRQPLDHRLDPIGHDQQIGIDFGERAGRFIDVEMPVERNFIADFGLVLIDPGIGRMGQDFALEIGGDVLRQRHILGIALCRIGLLLALGLAALA
jgi:hypothetical protein